MTQWQAVRWVGLLVVALLAMTGLQQFVVADGEGDSVRAAEPQWGPATYDEELEALDRVVARGAARLAANPNSWAAHEAYASALHVRGQLTGAHEDLAAALESADTARDLAPEGSGPVLSRSVIAMSLHRNDIAGSEVPRIDKFAVPADVLDRSEAQAILGDVALYAGKYAKALDHYRAAEELGPGLGIQIRLADWHRHHGDFDEARRVLRSGLAEHSPSPWGRAAVLLQLGAIDLQNGDWDAAESYFAEADRAFPGWWLAKAHLGQMAASRGELEQAEALYLEAMKGAERPSVMNALSAVYEAQGRDEAAEAMAEVAGKLWKARVASHPAAYADHAFDAVLAEGDTAKAWQLARLNYVSRPYGDGRIGLARAAAARGRDQSARAILEELERTGWRSTEQYRVLTEVCERLGDGDCAEDARAKALAISPKAFDTGNDFHFFSNH